MSPDDPTATPPKQPATGSFPGFKLGLGMFEIWTRAAKAQGELLNGVWAQLKDGTFDGKEWGKGFVKYVEITTGAIGESLTSAYAHDTAGGPPWVCLSPRTPRAAVRLSTSLPASVSQKVVFSQMGGGNTSELVTVTPTAGVLANVELPQSAFERFPKDQQFLGFVTDSRSTSPLVIVTIDTRTLGEPDPGNANT